MNLSGGVISRDVISGVEQCIENDRQEGNFDQIHHIWLDPRHAGIVGLQGPGECIHAFRVNHKLSIVIDPLGIKHGGACGFVGFKNRFTPIDIFKNQNPRSCIEVYEMTRNLAEGLAGIGAKKIDDKGYVHFDSCVAFVAAAYTGGSLKDIVKKLAGGRIIALPKAIFGINHSFPVVVSPVKPKSNRGNSYSFATVDKDGWIVGRKPA